MAKIRVDIFQFEDFIIRHLRFGEQDVHVPRHPARDGVDGVFHFNAFFLQLVAHLFESVLGLGDGHAVTGHDDDLGGVLHDESRVFGRAALERTVCIRACATGGRIVAAKAAEDDRDKAPVHARTHDIGQDRARRADERAGDDQREIAQREAERRCSPARIGVQHRDDDRHVRAANRDDQSNAEDQGKHRDAPESPLCRTV